MDEMARSSYFIITLVIFLISALLPPVSSSGSCPENWTVFGNQFCISISSQIATWEEASSNCKLINIPESKDNDLLEKILRNLTNVSNRTEEFYIGLKGRKLNSSNQVNFTWTDTKNVYNFTNWRYINETNASLFNDGDHLCGYIDSEAKWRLWNCTKKARYICQQSIPKVISTAKPTNTTVPSNCKPGWHEIQYFCIYISNKNESWDNAHQACRNQNSFLVLITNKQKDIQLIDVLNKTVQPPSQFYIGLRREKNDMIFKWINGNMYNYTNWYSHNETTRPAQNNEGKLCAYYGLDFNWHLDGGCSTPRRYICQIRKRGGVGGSPSQVSTAKPTTTTEEYINERISMLKGKNISDAQAEKELKDTMEMLSSINIGGMSDIQNIIELVEKIGEVLIEGMKKAGNITEPKRVKVKNSVMVLGITLLPPTSSSNVQFPQNGSGGSINLPGSVIKLAVKTPNNSDGVGLTSLFLPGVGNGEKEDTSKPVLNSGIMSTKVSVPEGTIQNLEEPVVISLPHAKKLENDDDKILCSFIDTKTNQYSTAGCNVAFSNKTFTVCHCNHLTSFAVLLDVHGNAELTSDEHKFALLVVSIVGCCIALICFIAALFAFHFVMSERRRRKTETVSIHKNLAVAEILALVFFLLAYGVSKPKGLCFAITLLLHYSLMAVFFWMLVEGLNLHRGTVQVFITTSRMKVYYIIGWGIPWIFVVATAAVGQMEYPRADFCWISQQFIWAFAGPVAVILFINFVILCIAIRVMVRRPRYKTNRVDDSSKSNAEQELRIAFKTTVILLPLLGLTWLLGFLASNTVTGNTVIQYLFAIINSLQGVYFFLAHCMYDEDVIRATNNTSTRLKTYFSRTLSRSNPSDTSTSAGGYGGNASFKRDSKDIVFEMPSVSTSSKGQENPQSPRNHKYVDIKTDASSKSNDKNNIVSIQVPDFHPRHNRVGSSSSAASECSESMHADKKELSPLKEDAGSRSPEMLFRRAKSAIVKFSEKSTIPRRANSVAEPTRMKLSKQTSNESNISAVSGTSNTAFLSGC